MTTEELTKELTVLNDRLAALLCEPHPKSDTWKQEVSETVDGMNELVGGRVTVSDDFSEISIAIH